MKMLNRILQVVVYTNICALAILVCSTAMQMCIPGYAYEPEISMDILLEDAE